MGSAHEPFAPARRHGQALSPSWAGNAIVAVALALGPLAGVLLADRPKVAIAFVLGVVFTVLVFLRLTWGLWLWVPLVFIPYLAVANILIKLAVVLIAVAWLGHVVSHRAEIERAVRRHGALLGCVALWLAWMALSLLWADDTAKGVLEVWQWYPPVMIFLIVATTLHTRAEVTTICTLFVAGAIASMLAGAVGGGLTAAGQLSATAAPERLQGGAGDPNILAAGLVPAIVLAGALLAVTRGALVRGALLVAAVVMGVGLVASQSRGGLIAAVVTSLAALAVFKRQRIAVLCLVAIVASGLGLALAGSSAQRERFLEFNDGGSGRSTLWKVAWRLGASHPIVGVGSNNFLVRAQARVRDPGTLDQVANIQDEKVAVAHNTPLQAFVDTGVIGFALLVALLVAAMRSVLRAAHAFERIGERGLGTLARGVLVAQISMLAAAFFLTMGRDYRWWLLFAIGPALGNLAAAMSSDERRPATLAA